MPQHSVVISGRWVALPTWHVRELLQLVQPVLGITGTAARHVQQPAPVRRVKSDLGRSTPDDDKTHRRPTINEDRSNRRHQRPRKFVPGYWSRVNRCHHRDGWMGRPNRRGGRPSQSMAASSHQLSSLGFVARCDGLDHGRTAPRYSSAIHYRDRSIKYVC